MKKIKITAAALAAVFFCASGAVAQVEVVESQNRLLRDSSSPVKVQAQSAPQLSVPTASAPQSQSSAQPPTSSSSDLFYQLQTLQQEIQELRGLVEEQDYEIKRLKQQRLDDYVNLDRRLSELSGQAVSTDEQATTKPPLSSDGEAATSSQIQPSSPSTAQPDEMQRYRNAIDLVLKQKDYAQAVIAFNEYLKDYPNGRYAANSQYWMGEIALLNDELEQAREWFSRILSEFPSHRKIPDATFKLGVVYHKLGNPDRARELLERVASGDSNTASIANRYLTDSFP